MPRTIPLQLAALAAGVLLTVGNAAGPPLRGVTRAEPVQGDIPIQLDQRYYGDKPLEAVLPAGSYTSLELVCLRTPLPEPVAPDAEPPPPPPTTTEVVLSIPRGDPRLGGDPVRVELLPPAEPYRTSSMPETRKYVLDVKADGGRASRLEFTIEWTEARTYR